MNGAIALIPARGGSRRIPRKNVRPFLGVPAIARVVETLQRSELFERIIVSTDDPEIAEVATGAGAEVPGVRPAELSDDHTPTVAVVRHAISAWLGEVDDSVPLWTVYPTAVLLTPELLAAAQGEFARSDADFLIPVLRYPHPVERRFRMDGSGALVADDPSALGVRSQDLEPAFHDSGQFYIAHVRTWLENTPLASGRNVAIELPPSSAIDIDEPAQWTLAEHIARSSGN